MKKYDVSSLKVIKVENDNDFCYLICKYNKFKKSYVELFTNEKINLCDDKNIFSISLFLSYLGYEAVVMLDKQELSDIYLSINNISNVQDMTNYIESQKGTDKINEELENATLNFFPKSGSWTSGCFKKSKELSMSNLPCNLRDDVWLAMMLEKNQNLSHIKHKEIRKFVKSSFFQEKIHEYELEIVRWQIKWIMNRGENWIIDENYGGDFVYLSPVVDLGVRKGVIDTLTAIGMNIDVIEEGIERHANIWRNQMMEIAFENEYKPINFLSESQSIPVSEEHREKWLQLRRYEYYQRHKKSVDLYGSVEPDMLMNKEEVEELKNYLNKKHQEIKGNVKKLKQGYIGW